MFGVSEEPAAPDAGRVPPAAPLGARADGRGERLRPGALVVRRPDALARLHPRVRSTLPLRGRAGAGPVRALGAPPPIPRSARRNVGGGPRELPVTAVNARARRARARRPPPARGAMGPPRPAPGGARGAGQLVGSPPPSFASA